MSDTKRDEKPEPMPPARDNGPVDKRFGGKQ